ncbi:porin family protein [Bacillus subtilis]|uniref:outer membrane protein n=1 Tax=Pseudochrobactrum asaccharolyticum TaxID=354351 RepID=UPI000EFCE766|nr:outer membrane protein [Pseudochrobactrum asaccharolyticum]MCF7646088.1 porin family protein [Pseudochrobactrum asaccharolyticum]MCF7672555.1 porin family protein [Bacillus subtilis]
MRNIILFSSAAFALALTQAPALAADAFNNDYSYNDSSSSYDAPATWEGNYVGAQIGTTSSKTPSPFSSRTSALGGIVAGKNFQSGNFVYGGELEGNFGEAEHKIQNGGRLQQSWSGVAKVKAGYAMDKTLVYGTVGYGTTKFKPKDNVTSGSKWAGGVQLGAGVEQQLSGPFSVKAEYNYMRHNGVKTSVNDTRYENNLKTHALKAGVNYRF